MAPVPVLGDMVGAVADGRALYQKPSLLNAVLLGAGLLPFVPAGAAVRAARTLPMDHVSRMARARAMGFHVDMPVYHGTAGNVTRFDPSRTGAVTGGGGAHRGVSVALDPRVAAEFAELAARRRRGSGQSIIPLIHRADRPAVLDLDGTEAAHEVRATLDNAFANGYDAVMLRNYISPGGLTGKKIIIVRSPNQLRSRFARFDPRRIKSPNLLAGIAAGSVAVPMTMPREDER